MSNYFDKVLILYPDIQHVMYWHTQYDGAPWDDPYDGLVWENKDIKKPTKKELDAVIVPKSITTVSTLETVPIQDQLDALNAKIDQLTSNMTAEFSLVQEKAVPDNQSPQ